MRNGYSIIGLFWIVTILGLGGLDSLAEANRGNKRTDIYFAAFFPMNPVGSQESKIGHGVMPAVKLAIKHINQSPNILHGYKLHMYWNDTQVCRKDGIFCEIQCDLSSALF